MNPHIHDTGSRRRISVRRRLGVFALVALACALLAALDAFVAAGPALGLSALAARFTFV